MKRVAILLTGLALASCSRPSNSPPSPRASIDVSPTPLKWAIKVPVEQPTDDLSVCQARLKQFGTFCEIYCTDFQGRYPSTPDKLAPKYVQKVPECPTGTGYDYQVGVMPDEFTVSCKSPKHQGLHYQASLGLQQNGQSPTPTTPQPPANRQNMSDWLVGSLKEGPKFINCGWFPHLTADGANLAYRFDITQPGTIILDAHIRFRNLESGKETEIGRGNFPGVSPQGTFVTFESERSGMQAYNTKNGRTLSLFDLPKGEYCSEAACISDDAKIAAFAPSLKDGATPALVNDRLHGKSIKLGFDANSICLSRDASLVCISDKFPKPMPDEATGSVNVYNTRTGALVDSTVGAREGRISGDGQWVVMVASYAIAPSQVCLKNLKTGMISQLTRGDVEGSNPAISDDGRFVTFCAKGIAMNKGDKIGYAGESLSPQIYLADCQSRQMWRLSQTPKGAPGDWQSLYPDISGDGRNIVFVSNAKNLMPAGSENKNGVFLVKNPAIP